MPRIFAHVFSLNICRLFCLWLVSYIQYMVWSFLCRKFESNLLLIKELGPFILIDINDNLIPVIIFLKGLLRYNWHIQFDNLCNMYTLSNWPPWLVQRTYLSLSSLPVSLHNPHFLGRWAPSQSLITIFCYCRLVCIF